MNEGEQSLVTVSLFLWRSKYIIVSSLSVLLALALLFSFLATPVYRAEGSYQYVAELENKGILGLGGGGAFGSLTAGLSGSLFSGGGNVQSALETVKSRAFLIGFAYENNLARQLFPEFWDAKKEDWITDDATPSDWEISERLNSKISATLDNKAGLITISVKWDDPIVATKLLSDFVEKANSDFRDDARDRTSARLDYLTAALGDSKFMEVKMSIGELIKAEVERKMMISLEKEYAFRTVSPPVPPDHDAYVSPNRSLLITSAIVFGFFFGLFISYARELMTKHKDLVQRSAG